MVERRQLLSLGGLGLAATLTTGGLARALSEAARADEGGSGQLAGLVVSADGAPIAGAIVTVVSAELHAGDATLSTDDAGRFALGPVRPGLYDVVVELTGYRRGSLDTLKVEDGHTTQAEIVLERRTGGEDGY